MHPDTATTHDHDPPDTSRRWPVLAVLCLAQFMLVLDVTVVNVALPSIGADLGLGRDALTWVVTAYALSFGGLMLLGGRIADLAGRRGTFLVGLVVFTAASLTAGLAGGAGPLIGGRIAQGAGAALMSPSALALVTTTFHGADRNRALGVWAAVGGTGSAFGVLVGGLLTDGPGWEWIFFVNVPVGAAVFAGVLALVAADAPAASGTAGGRAGRVDVPGAVLVTGATALLILGVTRSGDDDWSDARVWVPLLGAALAYAAFALVQHRTREPLVPLGVLTRRPLVAGAFTMLVATGLLVSSFFLGSMYLQHTVGLSAFRTGLTFLPVAVAVVVGAHLGGQLVGRVGPRWVAVGAMAVAAAGCGLLTGLPADGEVLDVLPGLVVAAFGVGPAFVAATTTAMADVCPTRAGVTSGVVNTFHELGAALGVALASATAAVSLAPGAATADGYADAFLGGVLVALAAAAVMLVLAPAGRPAADAVRHVH